MARSATPFEWSGLRSTLERFKRQIALAQARGEPMEPLIRRLVLETIE